MLFVNFFSASKLSYSSYQLSDYSWCKQRQVTQTAFLCAICNFIYCFSSDTSLLTVIKIKFLLPLVSALRISFNNDLPSFCPLQLDISNPSQHVKSGLSTRTDKRRKQIGIHRSICQILGLSLYTLDRHRPSRKMPCLYCFRFNKQFVI